jgi:REP element-mobilizing transposase RayT
MARKPRIEYEGAFYHVIIRGNQKQKIFRDKYDFARYLIILSDYKNQYKYYLHAYALMDNHVHLIMEEVHSLFQQKIQDCWTSFSRQV